MTGEDNNYGRKNTILPTVSLFTSLGTLVCCALPALFVSIGAGATLAGLLSAAPWLVSLSKYKIWTFGISGVLILVAGYMMWRSRSAPCPVNQEQARACSRLRKISKWIYCISVIVWLVGFFFAFIAVEIFF
jgi:predicted small integral membrane protein